MRVSLVLLSIVVAVGVALLTSLLQVNRSVPAGVPVAAASPDTISSSFPLGIFEDATLLSGRGGRFKAMLDDLQARGLDSVMLTNSYASRDASLLDVSDRQGMGVFFALADLHQPWWASDGPADRAHAESLVRPALAQLTGHPSLKGYSIADEPSIELKDKLTVLTDVLNTLDPERPAMPILIGLDRVQPLFEASKPRVMLIDVYPFGYRNPVGDLSMSGYGYWFLDFISYVRAVSQSRPPGTPLWMILQTHSFKEELRKPIPAEVRLQNWLAIGEGATGLFWFIYSSQQGWVGLQDSPALMAEVTDLVKQVRPIRDVLVRSAKIEDVFQVEGENGPYVSTLKRDDGRLYAVVANRDVLRAHDLKVTLPGVNGVLRNVTGGCTVYQLGQPIPFEPGAGAVLEFLEDGDSAVTTYSGGVPSYPVDYAQDVTTWWANHPLNADSPCHVAESAIVSPPRVVNVAREYGSNIQAAIDALPGNGGTLYFEPGVYNNDFRLVGRSNVHFVSDGGAIFRGGPSRIAGCSIALDYGEFNRAFSRRDPSALSCGTTDRIHNIYFKNIVFDGGGSSIQAISMSAARDVLFDGVTLRNFVDPKEHHRGLISATAMLDNIWVRGSHFVGNERYALYFDGAQGSGVIESTIEPSFGSGGLLFLTNDDFSMDLNNNDAWDAGEMRHSNFVVVANNVFTADSNGRSLYAAVSYTGANALISGNRVEGAVQVLADLANRCSQRWSTLPYEHTGSRVIGNRVRSAKQLVTVSGQTINCAGVDGTIGRYEVKDNVIEKGSALEGVAVERGPVIGPNVSTPNWPLGVTESGGSR
ncbi:MAG: hypothetical protein AB7P40_04225 [Chloroflexota bacterium]